MRRLLFILALVLSSISAHAACSANGCVQTAYGEGSISGTYNIAFGSGISSASNTLMAFTWVHCATPPTLGYNLGYTDTAGNSWNESGNDGQLTSGGWALVYGWTQTNTIATGANTVHVAMTYASGSCVTHTVIFEYSGIIHFVNGGFNQVVKAGVCNNCQFPSPSGFPTTDGGSTQWPAPPITGNLYLTLAVHDTGNTGTFTNSNGSVSSIGTFSGASQNQMAFWDQSGYSANPTIGNTGGSNYNTAFVATYEINTTAAPPPVTTFASCSGSSGGSTVGCSFIPIANSFAIITANYTGWSFTPPPTISGCSPYGTTSGTWTQIDHQTYGGGQVYRYIAFLTGGSSCTVVFTLPSATGSGSMSIVGTSFPANQYPIEFSLNQSQAGTGPIGGGTYPPSALGIVSTGANDTVYIDAAANGFGTSMTCSGGYTAIATQAGIGASMGACIKQGVSPGAQGTTFSNFPGSQGSPFFMILRTAPVTFGAMQLNECPDLGANPIICQFLFPVTAGDNVKAMVPIRNGNYTLADTTGGNTGFLLPGQDNYLDMWQFENISSTQPTFSLSGGNVANSTNLVLTEWKGEATAHSYVDGASNWDAVCTYIGPCTNLSWSSTPIHLLQAGSYNMVSTVTDFPLGTITGPTGFTPIFLNQNDGGLLAAVYDEQLTTTGPTTQVSIPSWATEVAAPQVSLYAFGQIPYTLPHVVQTAPSNAQQGTAVNFPNKLQASGSIIVGTTFSTGNNLGGTWGISTSSGTPTLIRGGTTANDFQTIAVNNPTGGSTFTFTDTFSSNVPLARNWVEVWPATAVQGANSQTCGPAGTACSPSLTGHTGNATTTNPTSIVLSFFGVTADEFRSLVTGTDTSWTQTQQASGDYVGYSAFSKTVLTPGTWNNVATSPVVSYLFDGIIVPLTVPTVLSNVQPNVTVITENRVKDSLPEAQ